MRYYLLLIALLLSSVNQTKATSWSTDWILLADGEWFLLEKPIRKNKPLYDRLEASLPRNHSQSTGNWDGYTSLWSIRNDQLYLEEIVLHLYDETKQKNRYDQKMDPELLQTIFADYVTPDGIRADWYSGELRSARGTRLLDFNLAFSCHYETEQVMQLQQGRITESQCFQNSTNDGLEWDEVVMELRKRVDVTSFPELTDKSFIIAIESLEMTTDGQLTDCQVEIVVMPGKTKRNDPDDPLVKQFKTAFQSISPWRIYFINGNYRTALIRYVAKL